jgi:hypothetical protein
VIAAKPREGESGQNHLGFGETLPLAADQIHNSRRKKAAGDVAEAVANILALVGSFIDGFQVTLR